MAFWSQAGQDQAVVALLKGKREGTFLDVGCMDPMWLSNTCTLEQEYGWRGVGIDMDDSFVSRWKIRPNTKFYLHDALTINYRQILKDNDMPKVIDFLSLDLEPPNLTLECLYKLPFDEYIFRVIAFETDHYREDFRQYEVQSKSREYLTNLGYIFIQELHQDDLWVHRDYLK